MTTLPTLARHNQGSPQRRRWRYAARDLLWSFSSLKSLRACGRTKIDTGAPVAVALGDGVAHFRNVQRCASVHACPVCSAKIRAARAGEIDAGVTAWRQAGHGAEFLTLTLPHDVGDRLAELVDAVADSWRRTTGQARGWKEERELFGIVGTIRVLEVTHGLNGWHPHLHVLLLTEAELDDVERRILLAGIEARWGQAVVRHGYRAPAPGVGVTMTPVRSSETMARYMSKVMDEAGRERSVGMELARGDLKAGRRKGRNPFEILADVLEDGDVDDLALWGEYERATKGRRVLTWSKGLKELLDVDDVTDEELVDEEAGGEVVIVLDEIHWRRLKATRGGMGRLLELVELDDDGRAAWGWLRTLF